MTAKPQTTNNLSTHAKQKACKKPTDKKKEKCLTEPESQTETSALYIKTVL